MRVAQFLSANDSLHVHGSGGLSPSVTASRYHVHGPTEGHHYLLFYTAVKLSECEYEYEYVRYCIQDYRLTQAEDPPGQTGWGTDVAVYVVAQSQTVSGRTRHYMSRRSTRHTVSTLTHKHLPHSIPYMCIDMYRNNWKRKSTVAQPHIPSSAGISPHKSALAQILIPQPVLFGLCIKRGLILVCCVI